jgi:Holliday junction DNA helicase RuvA
MIASIEGNLTYLGDDFLVINVGGVGFKVLAPPAFIRSAELFKPAFLHTYLVVRVDSLTLFGFEHVEERDMFVLMLGVPGVGPKTALSIVSSMSLEMINKAVLQEQPGLFANVAGVGKKSAQSIILNLQGKLMKGAGPVFGMTKEVDTDIIAALTNLGYSLVEAQTAIQMIPKDAPTDLESRLRIALQQLA